MNTPRTDAAIFTTHELNQMRRGLCANEYDAGELQYIKVDFARKLETEVQELRGIIQKYLDSADKPLGMSDLADIDAEARAILARTGGNRD